MHRCRNRRGQAAVEGLLAIPVLMMLFMIGFELWGLAWDAQYVNIKSRYDAVAFEDKRFRQGQDCQSTSTQHPISASVRFDADKLPLIGGVQQPITLTNYAVIECDP